MKRILFCLVICILFLCGCSINSNTNDINENGYNEGYQDGLEEVQNVNDYSEDLHYLQTSIAELMYDGEYETVRKIYDYNPDAVESALEYEFGVKDIDTVIDYLESSSNTVIGNCEICGESVYENEFAILPYGIECAHRQCISTANNESSYRIEK